MLQAADPLSEGPGSAPASELSGSCSASEDETLSDSCSEGEAAEGSAQAPARPGSIASTYWRDERRDRKELLAVIDERWAPAAPLSMLVLAGRLAYKEIKGAAGPVVQGSAVHYPAFSLCCAPHRFEHLALEYDDEEIGDMEEQEGEIQVDGLPRPALRSPCQADRATLSGSC